MQIPKYFVTFISFYGSTPFHLLLGLLLFSLDKTLGASLLLGFLLSLVLIVLIRLFYFRRRPESQAADTLYEKLRAASFPSGHVTRAFVISLLLASFLDNFMASFLFFFLALGVAVGRYLLRRHDFVDIIGGICTAVVVYFLVQFFLALPSFQNFLLLLPF